MRRGSESMKSGSFDNHERLQGHPTVRHSPDGRGIIEECETCGQRWHWTPEFPHMAPLEVDLEAARRGRSQ